MVGWVTTRRTRTNSWENQIETVLSSDRLACWGRLEAFDYTNESQIARSVS